MRLLDENLDWRLRRDLLDHQVESVPLIGWAGIENGELLRKAVEAGFDVLVTMDSNMVHQQNIGQYAIAVVALRVASLGVRLSSSATRRASYESHMGDLPSGSTHSGC